MKVYYIGNIYDGCYYVRCLLPQVANGWSGEKETLLSKRKSLKQVAKEIVNYDVIVFQRPDEMIRVKTAKLLKQAGKKIVFDNDDTYKNVNYKDTKIMGKIKERSTATDEFLKIADLVTTTTEFLANEYRKLNKNVVVLPNMIDTDDWDEPLPKTDKIRIGIVGSTTTTGDYKVITPLLEKLNKDNRVQLVMFGLPEKDDKVSKMYNKEFNYWNKFNIEWQPFVPIWEYPKTLNELQLDIILIPRTDNYFNRCKSNIKFLEASMCKIATVAQGFKDGLSPYQGKEDSKHMEIAITQEDWNKKVYDLMENKEKRLDLSNRAYQYVITNYNISNKAHLLADAYKKIWNT